jgi:hypothetical protein
MNEDDLVYRLRKRAEIRRQIPTRKSVQNKEPDRLADLLEEAADEIAQLRRLALWLWATTETVNIRKAGKSKFDDGLIGRGG